MASLLNKTLSLLFFDSSENNLYHYSENKMLWFILKEGVARQGATLCRLTQFVIRHLTFILQ